MGNGMNKVLEGVYVGSIRDSSDRNQLKENKITHILSIHDNAGMAKTADGCHKVWCCRTRQSLLRCLPCCKKERYARRYKHKDMEYLCIAARDCASQDLKSYFSRSNDFIHQARLGGGNVLIHCLAGVSRSVTLTVVYIMTVTQLGWRDSLNAVRGARRAANPNFGFQRQLVSFEHEGLQEERARLLSKFDPTPFDDLSRCRDLLEKHREWVLHGDAAGKDMDEDTYPLPHRAYGERAGASGGSGSSSSGSGACSGSQSESGGEAAARKAEVKDEKTVTLEDYLNIKAEKEAKQFYKEQEEKAHFDDLRQKRASAAQQRQANTAKLREEKSGIDSTAQGHTATPKASPTTHTPDEAKSEAVSLETSSTAAAASSPGRGSAGLMAIQPSIVISVPASPSPASKEEELDKFFQ